MTEAKEQTKHELIGKPVLISLCMCSKAEIWEQAGPIVVWDLKSSLMSLPSHLWSTGDGVMLTKTFHSWSLSREPFVDLAILHPSRHLWVQGGHYWPHPVAICLPLGSCLHNTGCSKHGQHSNLQLHPTWLRTSEKFTPTQFCGKPLVQAIEILLRMVALGVRWNMKHNTD